MKGRYFIIIPVILSVIVGICSYFGITPTTNMIASYYEGMYEFYKQGNNDIGNFWACMILYFLIEVSVIAAVYTSTENGTITIILVILAALLNPAATAIVIATGLLFIGGCLLYDGILATLNWADKYLSTGKHKNHDN